MPELDLGGGAFCPSNMLNSQNTPYILGLICISLHNYQILFVEEMCLTRQLGL